MFKSDLKAEVHRKNSSESSDSTVPPPVVEITTYSVTDVRPKTKKHRSKHQRSKTDDGFVSTSQHRSNRPRQLSQEAVTTQRPGLEAPSTSSRRHSNFANSSPNFLPVTGQISDIKPTGSLELAFLDKTPEGFYFKVSGEEKY